MKALEHQYTISIAHLFYAIANADNFVNDKEKQVITSVITDRIIGLDKNVLNADLVFQTISNLDASNSSADDAYKIFSDFYSANKKVFTKKLKNDIIDCADKISAAFSKKNKSELIVLAKLSLLLK